MKSNGKRMRRIKRDRIKNGMGRFQRMKRNINLDEDQKEQNDDEK